MTIANGSFETQATAGQVGQAESWSVSETSTGEEFAEFTNNTGTTPNTTSGQETFEGEWPTSFYAGLIGSFVGYWTDINPALFTGGGTTLDEDGFEIGWGTGHQRVIDSESAPFGFAVFGTGTDEYDGFDDWPDDLVTSFVPADLEAASFDSTTPEDLEDFEEEWLSNEDYLYAFVGIGTDLDDATFQTSAASLGDTETFEGELFDLVGVTSTPATNLLTFVAHGLTNGWVITFTNSGGRLPDGVLAETEYYVISATTDTFQISATSGGTWVAIGDYGFGTHTLHHDPTYWWTEELTGV